MKLCGKTFQALVLLIGASNQQNSAHITVNIGNICETKAHWSTRNPRNDERNFRIFDCAG